jgi:hypothetical protein
MNSGHEDRLGAVTQDLHSVLERKLGDLLGQVQAAEFLARQVQSADDDIARRSSLARQLRDRGHSDQADSIDREVEAMQSLRSAHVDDLAKLVSDLHG